jgi:serine phosphatase RsbU (regulator of sigma subunit)
MAVVDCTGHGVPGSFMSIIGSTILSEIVNMMRMYSPAAILEELHTQIVRVLSQNDKGNDDGMDLSLMCFERNGNAVNITFCGAKNDLFYVKKGTETLEILAGDRKSIGGRQRADRFFSDKTLSLETGDCVYLFTDGMADQNDGSTRKFGSATLRRLLGQNAHKPMAQQEILLGREYHNFVGRAKQRDDITVLGFRL